MNTSGVQTHIHTHDILWTVIGLNNENNNRHDKFSIWQQIVRTHQHKNETKSKSDKTN